MWSVSEESGEYVIHDHNGVVRDRLPTGDGISTGEVKDVMRSRTADLKQNAIEAIKSRNIEKCVGIVPEWATIIEEMAGDQIQLPDSDENLPVTSEQP